MLRCWLVLSQGHLESKDSTPAPEKIELSHTQHLPRPPGLFNDSAKVCVVGMRWQWGYCFTRCTNTLVQHACIRSVPSWHRISHFHDWHLRQAEQNVPHLGARKPFVWVVKQRSVYLGLLDWRCPLSERRFSCQHLNKWGLICISLIPPPVPAPLEEFDFLFLPPPPLWIPSLFHAAFTVLSQAH